MLCAKSNRIVSFAALALFSALFAFGGISAARAQAEPPTSIPAGGPPPYDSNAIPFNTWLLYPSVNFLVENSNNYFIAPQSKLSGLAFGVDPTLTAVWSNGIHTTTLYATFQQLQYPSNSIPQQSNINSLSGEGTWTQQYSPLRDLNFTFVGDYQHQTLQAGLTSAIPTSTPFTGFIVLPDGNIQLPNGTIINPTTGQVVGQAGASASSSPTSFVNPYDTFTGTAKVQKLLSYGIVDLGVSVQRVDYENPGTANFNNKTFSGDGAFWLGSVFYVYSNGQYNIRDTDPSSFAGSTPMPGSTSDTYRAIGGIGTRQVGLFRASAYFGHQGSGSPGSPSSGGNVFGGVVTYYPTSAWTVNATIDETINLSPAGAAPSNQAIGIGGITPLQVSTSGSTQTTSTALSASYTINQQWTANGTFGFVHIENIGSPIWDNSYVADGQLSYQIWRNLTLTGEYQYSSIVTNTPHASAVRNLLTMSASYKF
jgi:hypothetical protein